MAAHSSAVDHYKSTSSCFPCGHILWNPLSPSSSSASPSSLSLTNNIIEFDGHFPCVDKNDKNDVSSEQCDSLDHVLVPRRLQCNKDGTIQQENNPVDIIFNERLGNDDELVQFWIDSKKHREDLSSRKHGSSILNHRDLRRGLQEIARRIKEDGSKIRHIVHVIVSPVQRTIDMQEKHVKYLKRCINKKASLPRTLESYTLCLVTPDKHSHDMSYYSDDNRAFENLVSQPIALTVPLVEQQMQDSWTRQVPSPSLVKHRLEKMKKDEDELLYKWCPEEFDQWRQIRFNSDCAVGIGHLFETEEEAEKNLLFEGPIKEQPHRSMEIPFGCILEALSILPPRTHGTSYCQCDSEDFRFKLRLTKNASSNSLTRFEISVINKKIETLEEEQQPLDFVTMNSEWLLGQIRVGHLLRFDYADDFFTKRYEADYQESRVLSDFWKKQVKEYSELETEKAQSLTELCTGNCEKNKTVRACIDVWDMSLGELSELLLKEDAEQHNRFCEICTALLDAEKNAGFGKGKGKGCSNAIVGELAKFLKDELTKYSFF